MAPKTDFPPIRACLFDMDGLLIDTEDLYTECINLVLAKYNKPPLPWSVKVKLQGRPFLASVAIFEDWAQLPVSHDDYVAELAAHQRRLFPTTGPLPGVVELLESLDRTRHWDEEKKKAAGAAAGTPSRVHIALATSSNTTNFKLKSDHLEDLFSVFDPHRRVKGDDPRIPAGRGKPLPDIYHLALETINSSLPAGEEPIRPEECLVFEDSVPGVEAGRRAGMRVIWVPQDGLLTEVGPDKVDEVLAGRTGAAGDVEMHTVGELGDGWAEKLPSLVDFPYERYGIVVPPAEVGKKEGASESANGVLPN